jgi:hypothetical protein
MEAFMPAVRIVLTIALSIVLPALAAAQEGTPAYAGADKCKSCHQAIDAAWNRTKHAHAIDRLTAGDRDGECIRCHVTGSAEQIAREKGRPSHPNVQCESCHGPASLHVTDPQVTRGMVRKPAESTCESCHNDKSPHYRGFVYTAMVNFVHPVKK